MKFKAGDEVFIKAEITDLHEGIEKPYFVQADSQYINWVSEDKIIPMEKTYEMGLTDAWELAKKIVMGVEDGGFDSQEVIDVFGKNRYYSFKDLTAEEALAKIEAYEKEKEIKVGDVVIDNDGVKALVVEQTTTDHFFVLTEMGSTEDWSKGNFKKTGKHIDIESLLKEIGE